MRIAPSPMTTATVDFTSLPASDALAPTIAALTDSEKADQRLSWVALMVIPLATRFAFAPTRASTCEVSDVRASDPAPAMAPPAPAIACAALMSRPDAVRLKLSMPPLRLAVPAPRLAVVCISALAVAKTAPTAKKPTPTPVALACWELLSPAFIETTAPGNPTPSPPAARTVEALLAVAEAPAPPRRTPPAPAVESAETETGLTPAARESRACTVRSAPAKSAPSSTCAVTFVSAVAIATEAPRPADPATTTPKALAPTSGV